MNNTYFKILLEEYKRIADVIYFPYDVEDKKLFISEATIVTWQPRYISWHHRTTSSISDYEDQPFILTEANVSVSRPKIPSKTLNPIYIATASTSFTSV